MTRRNPFILTKIGLLIALLGLMLDRCHAQQNNNALFNGPSPPWACPNCTTAFSVGPSDFLEVRKSDGIVRDSEGRDLADLPLAEQVDKLCAALQGMARSKFTKCGGSK